ncbi:MAG: hypothetical protein V4864_15080 [Pseudomonadota bacterium]
MFKKCLAAAAVAILVTACGGGSDTPVAATPQSAIEALRAQSAALAPMAVTPAAAADQLMNFGESTFPGFFPGHKTTGTIGPFAYRFYPETGVYLGVVVSASPGLELYGVYVMGGAFGGAPAYVGQLTNFINVDIGGGGGGGTGNGCYDLSLAETQGTHMQISYQYLGDITGNQTSDTLVGGMTTFQGYQARETVVTTGGTNVSGGVSVTSNFSVKNYGVRSGTAEMTQYGDILSGTSATSGITSTMNSTSVYTPPFVDQQYSLAVGQTYTSSQTLITSGTVSVLGFSQPINSTTTTSMNLKYVGQETVQVPAGTYNACKMETTNTSNGTTTVQTSWIIVGKGIPVKTTMTGGGINQTIQATSVKLNGASL